jgi:HAE1 family hydrophobic/amphiphilic exporter-1
MVSLKDLVRIEEKPTLSSVARVDRERAVSIYGNIAKGKSQQEALDAVNSVAQKILAPGYYTVLTGSAEDFKTTFQSLILALVLGLIIAYMVLASQFNSFVDPFSVLMALPFSVSGAFIALLLTKQSLNMYSMIGLLLLMGIVKKNSILLVDFTNQVRARGLGVLDSLKEACPTRLRPILMTSLATIVGAIPAALTWGPGAETRRPMAIAVIGGVFLSTLLTLYVVPCVYSLLSVFVNKNRRNEEGDVRN